MSDVPYEGATAEQLAHPFVQELLAIHNMFRNELARMLRYVEELIDDGERPTDAESAAHVQALVRSGMQYTRMLHTHHHIETASMFPMLQEHGLEAAVVERLNAEHDEIAVLIDDFNGAVHELSAIDPEILNSDLRRLGEALRGHLAYEETHVCPLLARFSS